MRKLWFILLIAGFGLAQEVQLPSAKLKDLQNKNAEISELVEGKLTLVNFWASYCVPCRKEMKYLDQMHADYEPRNVQVLGIAIDDARTVGRVKSMVKSQRISYPIYLDTEQKLYKTFSTEALPFSILVGPDGKILWDHTGYVPGDEVEMEKEIRQHLNLVKKD